MPVRDFLKRQFRTFDLLGEYSLAARKTWLDILWGASMPSIIFLLWWIFGSPSPVSIALYLVAILFFAGYYVWRADHERLIPKFEVKEYCAIQTPTVDHGGRRTGFSTYFQLLPKCLTEAEVENCRGYLRRVEKWSNEHGWEPTPLNETVALDWSYDETSRSPVTLHSGIEPHLNLFFVHSSNNRINPCIYPMPIRALDLFFGLAEEINAYRFDVKVTAKDCKDVNLHVKVQVTNDPHKPIVELEPYD